MIKPLRILLATLVLFLSFFPFSNAADLKEPGFLKALLNDIRYTSRLKIEVDDNVFLADKNRDVEFKEIFLQSLRYSQSKENSFVQASYTGQIAHYNEEATDVVSHSANVAYSYRPFDGFSIGFKDEYNWLEDNKITTTIGDRVLDLGYEQHAPSLEAKWSLGKHLTFKNATRFTSLDVSDPANDDYIDNRRLDVKGEFEYFFGNDREVVGFAGLDYNQIRFPQISEKSSVTHRPYIGFKKVFPGLFLWNNEIGFEHINMDDERNEDDNDLDFLTSLETTFSLYTKLKLILSKNFTKPSLRREYTQYSSDVASLNISHKLNKRNSIFFDYSFEKQDFAASHVTSGQSTGDRQTYVHNIRLLYNKKLKSWLSMDCQYDYVKRDTTFDGEGYRNNKFSVALTARY